MVGSSISVLSVSSSLTASAVRLVSSRTCSMSLTRVGEPSRPILDETVEIAVRLYLVARRRRPRHPLPIGEEKPTAIRG